MAFIWPYVVLIILGCGWGLTIPLTVISVKTGFGHLGIIFWQFFIIVVVFGLRQIFLNKKQTALNTAKDIQKRLITQIEELAFPSWRYFGNTA
mgnify:CR=1 FL=1